MGKKEIVITKGLYTGYSDKQIVCENINAHIERGSLTCLIGRNGAGKSTLMRTMCGFLKPIHGEVLLDGKKIEDYSHNALSRRLSVVLTEIISEINYLTVRSVVEMGRYPYCNCFASLSHEDYDIVDKSMKIVGIEDLAGKSMAALSDGQRQKVMIARALAQDTSVIVLDEPLSFLDMPSRIEIMKLLRDIAHTQEKAILLSSHDIELALHFADRLWVIDRNSHIYTANAPYTDSSSIIDDVFGWQSTLVKEFLKA